MTHTLDRFDFEQADARQQAREERATSYERLCPPPDPLPRFVSWDRTDANGQRWVIWRDRETLAMAEFREHDLLSAARWKRRQVQGGKERAA